MKSSSNSVLLSYNNSTNKAYCLTFPLSSPHQPNIVEKFLNHHKRFSSRLTSLLSLGPNLVPEILQRTQHVRNIPSSSSTPWQLLYGASCCPFHVVSHFFSCVCKINLGALTFMYITFHAVWCHKRAATLFKTFAPFALLFTRP